MYTYVHTIHRNVKTPKKTVAICGKSPPIEVLCYMSYWIFNKEQRKNKINNSQLMHNIFMKIIINELLFL